LHPRVRLLNGRDVMRALRLEPGPRVGALLEALDDAQQAGTVQTREQALAWLLNHPGAAGN
ncbi:MAG TPA: hypothetical protein VJS92_02715, partial [Candidatus Polarisedimenticolaceae bacterium]|nr:hypothetical protein [Candidatus Polarisedimenticolaceae bacterium]